MLGEPLWVPAMFKIAVWSLIHIHDNLSKMYQTIYTCTCINMSQIHLKEKLKQNSFAYYKGLMSKLRLYDLMPYYVELVTLLGALQAKFRPVYKCL